MTAPDPRSVVAAALDPLDPASPRAQRNARRVLEALRREYGVAIHLAPGGGMIVPLPATGAERAGTGEPFANTVKACSWCGGAGRWDDVACSACKGSGVAS